MRLFVNSLGNNNVVVPVTEIIEDATRWVSAARDSIRVSISNNLIEVSTDSGVTYPNSNAWSEASKVRATYIMANGNILLFTNDRKIYLTTSALNTITEKFVQAIGGGNYVMHTPVNASLPGEYWIQHQYTDYYNGEGNVHVFGSIGNIELGAAAINLFYTDDFGESFTIAYEFGQNPNYRDNGTAGGGITGTLLGDATNTIKARHIHEINYDKYNDTWYANTGDNATFGFDGERLWIKGTLSGTTWSWSSLNFGTVIGVPDILNAGGFFFREILGVTWIYWGNKGNGNPVANTGIWRAKVTEFTDRAKHEHIMVFDVSMKLNQMLVDETNGLVVGIVGFDGASPTMLFIAKDFGHGDWDLKAYPTYTFRGITARDSDGFYRIDTDSRDELQTRSFFFKPGFDLFDNI